MKRFILTMFGMAALTGAAWAQAQPQARKEPLADLIQSGDRKAALDAIRAGADVNPAQPDGTRPIHWAVYRVDHELLQALIAKKAQVNVRNEFGSTPIAEAAKLADADAVKMLLAAGAEPEGANDDGQSALMLAIKTGELPVVEALIKAGAKVNTIEKFHHQTPLMWAAASDKNAGPMVKMLLAKGADVKVRAEFTDWPSQITSEPRAQYRPTGGLTAMLYAARNGCYDCVDAMIAAGADPNVPTPEGVTPLMLALDNEHNDVAKLLLDKGANPSVWDWWGRTALYIVVDRKEANAVPAGRGRGGAGGRGGAIALPARGSGPRVSDMDIINALLAAGVDVNAELNMHRPSRGGNSGRFIDPLLNLGCTPLLRATMGGDMEVVRALLAKGANPNVNAMGVTSFLMAAGVGFGGRGTGLAAQSSAGGNPNVELMDVLLQNGADINAKITGTLTYSMRVARSPSANEGIGALHWAAMTGRAELVKYLLENGANPNVTDSKGRKPIELIAEGPAGRGGNAATPAASTPTPAGGRGAGAPGANSAAAAEIRALLEAATKPSR